MIKEEDEHVQDLLELSKQILELLSIIVQISFRALSVHLTCFMSRTSVMCIHACLWLSAADCEEWSHSCSSSNNHGFNHAVKIQLGFLKNFKCVSTENLFLRSFTQCHNLQYHSREGI